MVLERSRMTMSAIERWRHYLLSDTSLLLRPPRLLRYTTNPIYFGRRSCESTFLALRCDQSHTVTVYGYLSFGST